MYLQQHICVCVGMCVSVYVASPTSARIGIPKCTRMSFLVSTAFLPGTLLFHHLLLLPGFGWSINLLDDVHSEL